MLRTQNSRGNITRESLGQRLMENYKYWKLAQIDEDGRQISLSSPLTLTEYARQDWVALQPGPNEKGSNLRSAELEPRVQVPLAGPGLQLADYY